jgi:cell wall-associated NlpC family hydrolase
MALLGAIKQTQQPQQTASAPMPQIEIQARSVTPEARDAVALVKHYLGTPYVWGGENPGGFDCSGLLQYVWGKEGVRIPRTSQEQWHAGTAVGRGALRPGDAVFFGSRNGPHHVGMFIGNGQFIEAPHTGAKVRIATLSGRHDFIGGRRFAR